ncbi:hypothetical protein ACET3Z_023390 [Daucus carota]
MANPNKNKPSTCRNHPYQSLNTPIHNLYELPTSPEYLFHEEAGEETRATVSESGSDRTRRDKLPDEAAVERLVKVANREITDTRAAQQNKASSAYWHSCFFDENWKTSYLSENQSNVKANYLSFPAAVDHHVSSQDSVKEKIILSQEKSIQKLNKLVQSLQEQLVQCRVINGDIDDPAGPLAELLHELEQQQLLDA